MDNYLHKILHQTVTKGSTVKLFDIKKVEEIVVHFSFCVLYYLLIFFILFPGIIK